MTYSSLSLSQGRNPMAAAGWSGGISSSDTAAVTEYAGAPDNSFEFGLRSLLDGFEARLAADRLDAGVDES